jgi:general secretion pathway protein J
VNNKSGNLAIWQPGNLKAPASTRQPQLPDYQITRLPNRKAFTLLELLLALALTVIVAAILASSLYVGFRAKSTIEDAIDATRSTDIAADIIAHELTLTLPPTPSNAASTTIQLSSSVNTLNGTLIGPFEGAADSLDFFVSGPEPKTDTGLENDVREITYLLVPDTNASGGAAATTAATGQNLVRRVRTNLLEPTATDGPDEILARNVLRFQLSYYDGTTWTDTWDSTALNNLLPLAVQFTLELAPLKPNQKSRLDSRTIAVPCAVASTTTGGG